MRTPEVPAVARMLEEFELLGQRFDNRGSRLDEMIEALGEQIVAKCR